MAEELSRWLRRVRPATRADAGWAESAEGAEALAAIHRIAASEGPDARPVPNLRRRVWATAGGLAAAAAVAVLVVTLDTGAPPGTPAGPSGRGAPPPIELPGARPAALLLSGYRSCPDLLAGLREHAAAHVNLLRRPTYPGAVRGPVTAPAAGPIEKGTVGLPAGTPATGGTSTTNDQVAGVDEPDIMKTDGDRVLTLTDGVLHVLDGQSMRITGSLDLTMYAGWQNAQLLADGNQALVLLGEDYGGPVVPRGPIAGGRPASIALPAAPYGGPGAPRSHTTALRVDLSGTPTVTGSLQVDGGYLAARLVGPTVRLVTESTPTINLPQTGKHSAARDRKVVRHAPLSDWLPSYTITRGTTRTTAHVPCDRVSHPADYTGTSLVTVYTLDLAHPGSGPRPVSVVADGDTVYATADSLYVASNPDWWFPGPHLNRRTDPQRTELHRFDITGDGRPTYLGSGSVPGRLLSRYALDDYDGYLRVATTSLGKHETNGVYELADDTLTVIGHVGGLGRGEQLYAVRFAGPLGYVVTFRQTDPLYVLDLSDPRAPRVAGSLTLTGYSSYLHDAGDGRVIGVGEHIGRHNEPDGLKVSLFDVSDPAHPRRTSNVVRTGASGGAQLDPHAFLYWRPTGLIVVPERYWRAGESGTALVLRLAGHRLHTVGTVRNPAGTAPDDGLGIRRSMLVDGRLWTLSGGGVQVLDAGTLHRDAWLPFR